MNKSTKEISKPGQPILDKGDVSGCFVFNDLVELTGTIQIPKLTEKLVDEDYAAWLEEEIQNNGHSVRWVSLDDMGFISITFFDKKVTKERMFLVLSILNSR
jgi:hypothetical protein